MCCGVSGAWCDRCGGGGRGAAIVDAAAGARDPGRRRRTARRAPVHGGAGAAGERHTARRVDPVDHGSRTGWPAFEAGADDVSSTPSRSPSSLEGGCDDAPCRPPARRADARRPAASTTPAHVVERNGVPVDADRARVLSAGGLRPATAARAVEDAAADHGVGVRPPRREPRGGPRVGLAAQARGRRLAHRAHGARAWATCSVPPQLGPRPAAPAPALFTTGAAESSRSTGRARRGPH